MTPSIRLALRIYKILYTSSCICFSSNFLSLKVYLKRHNKMFYIMPHFLKLHLPVLQRKWPILKRNVSSSLIIIFFESDIKRYGPCRVCYYYLGQTEVTQILWGLIFNMSGPFMPPQLIAATDHQASKLFSRMYSCAESQRREAKGFFIILVFSCVCFHFD